MNPTSTPNHVSPSKHKSFKRGGGNSSANVSANGAVSHPPTTQDSLVEPPHNVNVSGKAGNDHRDSQKGAQSHGGNDHHPQQQQHNNQRGGYNKRGNSRSFNNRDHDRGNQEWNQRSRSFNNRDTHLQSQRGFPRGGGYMRPAVHTSASIIPPQMHVPMQPFGNNMLYPGEVFFNYLIGNDIMLLTVCVACMMFVSFCRCDIFFSLFWSTSSTHAFWCTVISSVFWS